MLIKAVVFRFFCPKCGHMEMKHQRAVGHDFSVIVEAIQSHAIPTCPKCKPEVKLKFDKIMCKPLKEIGGFVDKFGDEKNGFWVCGSHPTKKFFPIPLKDAVTKGDKYDMEWDGIGMSIFYSDIAKNGHPWKCPTCKEYLRYFDEREVGFAT